MFTIAVIALCLLFNAFLSAIEMSFVSVTKPLVKSLARSGNRRALLLLRLRENPERALSLMQIGITLVGAISAAVGGVGADESIAPWLEQTYHLGEGPAEAIAIVAVVVPITFLSVVLGELVPKTFAMRNPLRIALFGAPILITADRLLSPLVSLLEKSTRLVLRIFKGGSRREEEILSPEVNLDNLSETHQQYVMNLYHIERSRIRDIMLPWDRVAKVEWNQTMSDIVGIVVTSGHTRLPVLNPSQEVIGILHTKEFMAYLATGAENWQSLVRPVLRVRDNDSILRALRLMQEKRSHLSLVHSRDGNLIGIVTLEDIIEEIVGDIYDEDDDGAIKRILASAAAVTARSHQRKP